MSLTSPAAEQTIIGCCLQGQILADRVAGLLPEHFAVESHREAFSAILAAWHQGRPVDPVSLDDTLKGRSDSAGLAYWVECAEHGYSLAMLPAHVSTVRDKATRRALLAAADEIASLAHGNGDIREHVASAAAAVSKLVDGTVTRGPRLIGDVLRDYMPEMGARWEGRNDGLMTGFADLDAKLRGLRAGNLVLIAARPAMGKTALAMQIAANVSHGGVVVAFSQEMAETELADRLLASAGHVALDRIIGGGMTSDDHDRFAGAVGRVQGMRLYIDDQPAQRISDIRAKTQSVRRKHPIALVVVDYLQLMAGDGANRNAEIEQISRGLKALAKELGCPVIALSQLSRKCEERPNKRPMLSDLRDSGAIEQDADIVMMIYRDEVYNPDSPDKGTAEVLIRKNRQGQIGDVRLTWLGEYTSFADCSYQGSREESQPMRRRSRGFDEE
ncbi:replicative DNA helicase [Aromatoleum toluolicum]|uniref:Replicative DNA helicase n=1 Tax=Aromatoleum toluolicum TaxID=90060 RepID=A0ABX1NGK9_9RHOO|nr:replicative DNA helicase [Aromatoleum toluolicum]NMF98406.1 replicative DNA helicase [Aromatoleum toluolicum]